MSRLLPTTALLFAAAVLFAPPARGETTTYYFCSVGTESTYADNLAAAEAAGWTFNTSGNAAAQGKNGYSNPAGFSTANHSAMSPSWGRGTYITKLVFAAFVSNTNREIKVAPASESGSPSATSKALTAASTFETVEFEFDPSEKISGFTVSVTKPGSSGTAYIYYASVTTETTSGPVSLDTPTPPAASGIGENGFSLSWTAVENADGYAVEVLDGNGTPAGTATVSGTGATVIGLAADTAYTAKVKALAPAGSTAYADSAWSAATAVRTALAGGLVRATLFDETFDNVPGTGWSNSGAVTGADELDWAFGDNAIRAPKGLRLGTANNPGTATTRTISIETTASSAEVVLSFLAASYTGKHTAGTVTLIDATTGDETKILDLDPAVMTNAGADPLAGGTSYAEPVTVPASFKLRFESLSTASDKRLLLDSIQVTQVYDPNHVTLAAPTGLAASDIGDAGFSLSWSAVPNAGGYEVEVLPAGGTVSVSGTGATVTGLAADTAYAAKVKALAPAGSTTYADSAWSAPVSVRTTLAGGFVRETLFEENFTNQDNSWGSTAANLAGANGGSFDADELDWSGALVGARRSCAAVGTTEKDGFARTRVISLAGNRLSGEAAVSFLAVTPTATAARKPVTVRAFAIDADTGATNWTGTVVAPKLSSTDVTDIAADGAALLSQTVAALPETFYLRFEADPASEEKQFAIDAVLVAQTYRPLPAPATPAPVAGTPTVSSVEAIWPEVAGAAGYAVELRDAATGERLALDAACTATNRAFGSLESNRDYEIRVRALGDGTTVGNSPWSAPLAVRTAVNPNAPAFSADAGAGDPVEAKSEKRFAVSATRGGAAVPVRYAGIEPAPAGAAPAFSPQSVFSWTPDDDDAGKTFTATFATDGGAYQTNVVFAVTARPPLAAPAVAVDSVGVKDAAISWNAQSRAVSYEVRLWTGTADYTKAGVCYEDFGAGVLPTGWSQWGTGAGWYPNSGYERYRVKFTETGDTLVSKCHSAPVTELSFHTRSSSTTATSTWTLFASHGGTNETDWVQLQKSTITTASDTPISRSFESSDGYRRFKWEFTKDSGTLGLGAISATHAGAGPKFVAGFGSVAEARNLGLVQTLALVKLRPERDYFLEVTAVGEDGEKESAVVRFSTLPADKTTVLILR